MPDSAVRHNNRYMGMQFPDYVYVHYPLAIHVPGKPGEYIVVENEEQEKAVRDKFAAKPSPLAKA